MVPGVALPNAHITIITIVIIAQTHAHSAMLRQKRSIAFYSIWLFVLLFPVTYKSRFWLKRKKHRLVFGHRYHSTVLFGDSNNNTNTQTASTTTDKKKQIKQINVQLRHVKQMINHTHTHRTAPHHTSKCIFGFCLCK